MNCDLFSCDKANGGSQNSIKTQNLAIFMEFSEQPFALSSTLSHLEFTVY